jgi:hypothetical protein
MSEKTFELLIIDEASQSTIETEDQLGYSLLSNSLVASGGSYNNSNHQVTVNHCVIKVSKIVTNTSSGGLTEKGFLLNLKGQYNEVEPLRENLVAHIQAQGFNQLYILCDEVSEQIACNLYPQIYKVENALRGYLIKFMSTKIGPKWWEATAEGEWRKKVSDRKNNETVFSKYANTSAYLIDFSDLGKMVYAQSSGFNSKEEVVRKIHECEETPEAIRKLKDELKSNYQKFFKEHFSDNGFQSKWERLQWFRNKVAHNNLFTNKDEEETIEIAKNLLQIIKKASDEIPHIQIDESEREAIRDSIVEKGYGFDDIDEETFLTELKNSQAHFCEPSQYVVLSHFIKTHLGRLGFYIPSSFEMADQLNMQGKVEIYKVNHPTDGYDVSAIKIQDK